MKMKIIKYEDSLKKQLYVFIKSFVYKICGRDCRFIPNIIIRNFTREEIRNIIIGFICAIKGPVDCDRGFGTKGCNELYGDCIDYFIEENEDLIVEIQLLNKEFHVYHNIPS